MIPSIVMLDEMMTIKKAADNYGIYEEEEIDEEEEIIETEEEKACRILNVPHNATLDQIKKMRNAFAKVWHVDGNIVTDNIKMQEISWAYEILEKLRK